MQPIDDVDPYADCKNAIALVETEMGQMVVRMARKNRTSPEQFIANMKIGFDKGARMVMSGEAKGDVKAIMMVKSALSEIDLPSFRNYVAAKLGMM